MADLPPFIDEERRRHRERLQEQTGERWLSFSEAVALLREREPMSIGQAEAIIDDMRLAYYADGGPWRRQSGNAAAVRCRYFYGFGFGGPPDKPHRGNTFVSEADLIYWHDRNTLTPKLAPSPQSSRTPAPRASKTEISKIVAEYRRTDPNPTMDGACQFAQSKGVTGHQAAVRAEYREQSGRPRVGRRRKNP
jgi:hypothetical protein